MRKLTAVLVLVGLLTLPVVGLADSPNSQGNPRKPGTGTNPGLLWAATWGFYMSNGANWLGLVLTDWLYANCPPFPWPPGK